MSIYNYSEYISATEELSDVSNKIIPGQFYSFAYDYYKNPEINKVPADVLNFYDTLPLVYVYNLKKSKDGSTLYYHCLNLHHLPLKTRKIWLSVLRKAAGNFMEREQPITLPPSLMKTLMIKPKFAYRQYNINRIKYLRQVPFSNINELAEYAAPTYDNVAYQQVAERYSLYNPYTRKG